MSNQGKILKNELRGAGNNQRTPYSVSPSFLCSLLNAILTHTVKNMCYYINSHLIVFF